MAQRLGIKTGRLFRRAKRSLVGGVDSPVRSFGYVGLEPVLVRRGKGSRVYDYDGNSYIDYVLSWGASILGHAEGPVIRDVRRIAGSGLSFGTTNDKEVELAEAIRRAIPSIGKIRFVNSGTEAVMGAVRLARGCTKREKIVTIENAYHGHADYLLARAGSGLATLNIPISAGVPGGFIKDTIVAPRGNVPALEAIFRRHGRQIAAVLVEPVGANYGVIAPDREYLKKLSGLARKYGALIIFDEVITGFRFRYGSVAKLVGVVPDLICLGKIIGGGLPIGAYGARDAIMKHLAPLGSVYQASTFSGNPVVMQAGISTLKRLCRLQKGYERLADLAERLCDGLEREACRPGIDLKTSAFGAVFSIKFGREAEFRAFYAGMLARGVYLAPSEYEANFLSFAHSHKDIEETVRAARSVFEDIKKKRT